MTFGFNAFSSNGFKSVSISSRLTRIVAQYSVFLNQDQSVVLSVPGYQTDGTWGIFCDDTSYKIFAETTNSVTIRRYLTNDLYGNYIPARVANVVVIRV